MTHAHACQVPVFRYALERWPADQYELIVMHDGPLDAATEQRLSRLRAAVQQGPANAQVQTLEVSTIKDDLLARLWKQHRQGQQPLMAILYPRNAKEVPDRIVDVTPFSDRVIDHLIDSPLRQQLSQKVLAGDSAVWIFVPCGDRKQDDAALLMLKKQLRLNQQNLTLPDLEATESEAELIEAMDIKLKLAFSIVTLPRDAPQERLLLKMLLASEPDLEELDQPMAFPMLGRGRVLYALVGRGINPETIGMASRFIVGPCSCQVKEQNPGFDLLMACDWDDKLSGALISDPLPQTTGKPKLLTIPPGRAAK